MRFLKYIVKRSLIGACAVVAGCCVLAAINFIAHSRSIDRQSLGISADQSAAVCPKTIPDFYTTYVSERMANDHLLYAIASNESYQDPLLKFFLVEKYDSEFSKFETGERGGLLYEAYMRKSGIPTVLVAFRGTQPANWRDWFANFSWITGAIPVENEYAVARDVFKSIRERALAQLGSAPVSFVATGHSLGGGLAQHVAAGFPCVDAVVFDASFVTNVFQFAEPFENSVTIHVYDKDDELTRLRSTLFTQQDSPTYRWYPIKLSPCNETARKTLCHAITPFTIGMARAAVECQIGRPRDCLISKSDTRAQDVYCPSADGIKDELCKPALRRLGIQ